MKRLCVLVVLLPLSLSAAKPKRAPAADFNTLAEREQEFSRLEHEAISCEYPRLIANEVDRRKIEDHFQPPAADTCGETRRQYAAAREATETLADKTRFPLYSTVAAEQARALKAALAEKQLSGALQSPVKRSSLLAVRMDPWNAERSLRQRLGVIEPKGGFNHAVPKGTCETPTEAAVSEAFGRRYEQAFWHRVLLERGYDCTVALYTRVSRRVNGDKAGAQENFERLVRERTAADQRAIAAMRGQAFVLFPQLGFDIPSAPFEHERERLDFGEMNIGFQTMGARFYPLRRTTVAALDEQVSQSLAAFEGVLSAEKKLQGTDTPKVFVLGRSMGSLVLRKMLERKPGLAKNIRGVVLIGATPWGSVIAEYKSRMDLFDDAFLTLNNPLLAPVGAIGGVLDPSLKAFQQAAGRRLNYRTMSHRNETPRLTEIDLPVLNVIMLPASVKNYYNGSDRIAGVDPTFLLMSMYGPTEGSSPLAHASWDTRRSLRVIDGRLNHLAFWELREDVAMGLWQSAWLAGSQAGLF